MDNPIILKMALPKVPDIELVALAGLDRLAHHLGIEDGKIGEARLLVTEALINALEHSGDQSPTVRVEFAMTKEELTILVKDTGKGFEPSTIDEPDIHEKLGAKKKRGWGLKVMRSMSDEFQIESGRNGTKITIKKLIR